MAFPFTGGTDNVRPREVHRQESCPRCMPTGSKLLLRPYFNTDCNSLSRVIGSNELALIIGGLSFPL